MQVYGQLIRAQLENRTSDHGVTKVGMLWWDSSLNQIKIADGTSAFNILSNNSKCIFGTNATPANNIRFHRAANGVLQIVTADDTTVEGTLSTSIAQLSFIAETYPTVSLPAAGIAGRISYDSSVSKLKFDTGITWETLEAGLPTSNKNFELAENLTGGAFGGFSGRGLLSQAYYSSASVGTAISLLGTAIQMYSVCYDYINNKIVVCYIDAADSLPKCIVGAASGSTITFGSPVTISAGACEYLSCCFVVGEEYDARVVVCFTAGSGATKSGSVIGGEVSGDSITFGSTQPFTLNSPSEFDCCYDPTYRCFVIAFKDSEDSDYGVAIKGRIQSGAVSFFGSTQTYFFSGAASNIVCEYNTKLNKVMIASTVGLDLTIRISLADCSGSSVVITNDNSLTITRAGTYDSLAITYDPITDIVLLAYQDAVGATGLISAFKIASDLTGALIQELEFSAVETTDISLSYDNVNKKFGLAYILPAGVGHGSGNIILGEITDNEITLGTAVEYSADSGSAAYSEGKKALIFAANVSRFALLFNDNADSDLSKIIIIRPLTPNQAIGILNTSGSLGETKDVSLMGAISGTFTGKVPGAQGFVQSDLSIAYKKTNFPFGQFVSATELLLGRG